ncbi:Replicative DNA helicase [Lachnospiraceae bacterium TWA4]|nr:Replicative DNA helicase [Lachnospiraceae bacterium TWA4]
MEAERSVLGSMLMDREAIVTVSEMLSRKDFYNQQYGIIFESMIELFNEGKAVDLITLQERLKEKNLPDEVVSIDFTREILMGVVTSTNVKDYAKIVVDKALLRRVIKVNEEISIQCYEGKQSCDEILEYTEKAIFDLIKNRTNSDYTPIKQVVLNALDKIEQAAKNKSSVTGLPTGFTDLDYKTAGLQPSDLVLVAARPSMGKTAFVLNIAQNVVLRSHETCAIFSLEMSKEQLVNRLFAMDSYVNSQNLRTGNLTETDWEKLVDSAGRIGSSKLIIDDTPGISISELRSKCRRFKLENDLKLVMIDYLQLMSGSGRSSDSRQQEISEISRSLKALAREIDCPVIALSQLSRACEARQDHRPMLSDLRESGAIEQDADVVMFIYRDDYYNKDSASKNISEIIIAKQRNGPTGTVELAWLPDYTKFGNLQKNMKVNSSPSVSTLGFCVILRENYSRKKGDLIIWVKPAIRFQKHLSAFMWKHMYLDIGKRN